LSAEGFKFNLKQYNMYLIEIYKWKGTFINEEPTERYYANKKQVIDYLNFKYNENKHFNPDLNLDNLILFITLDDQRCELIKCFELNYLYVSIDPPSGWKYGFPKYIFKEEYEKITDLKEWCIQQGYPIEEANKYTTFPISVNK
jgi:hypothetical protein